jgi:hypothetical protein
MTDPTFVYLIAFGDFIKIGVAKNPTKRAAALRIGMPEPPVLFDTRRFPSRRHAFVCERILHHRFRERRAQGEWFRVSAVEATDALRGVKVPLRALRPDAGRWDWHEPSESADAMIEALLTGSDLASRR